MSLHSKESPWRHRGTQIFLLTNALKKPQYFGSSIAFFSPDLALAWRLADNECHVGLHWEIPGLYVFDWEHSLQSLSPLTQKCLFLSIPRALTLETLRFFSRTSVLFTGTHHAASPVPARSGCCVHRQLGSLTPACCFPPWNLQNGQGGEEIPCDLTLPPCFQGQQSGITRYLSARNKGDNCC